MVKQSILITYKNGSSINIDVPENWYAERYKKSPESKLHRIFIQDYKKFVTALNKNLTVVDVNKYLKFSNASICGKDILSVDIKSINVDEEIGCDESTYIPGLHDQVYLNLTDTKLEKALEQTLELNLIENLSKLIDKITTYFQKSNVEFTIKAGKKTTSSSSTSRKKKVSDNVAVSEEVPTTTILTK